MVENGGSSLNQVLSTFIETFNQKPALSNLVKEKTIKICFETTDLEHYYLFFENSGALTHPISTEEKFETVTIKGKKQIITEIVKGQLKLRQAISDQDLIVTATFRSVLLLESIFYLVNPTVLLGKNQKGY